MQGNRARKGERGDMCMEKKGSEIKRRRVRKEGGRKKGPVHQPDNSTRLVVLSLSRAR